MTRINFSKTSVECRMSGNVKEGFNLLQNSEFIYDIIEILHAKINGKFHLSFCGLTFEQNSRNKAKCNVFA